MAGTLNDTSPSATTVTTGTGAGSTTTTPGANVATTYIGGQYAVLTPLKLAAINGLIAAATASGTPVSHRAWFNCSDARVPVLGLVAGGAIGAVAGAAAISIPAAGQGDGGILYYYDRVQAAAAGEYVPAAAVKPTGLYYTAFPYLQAVA